MTSSHQLSESFPPGDMQHSISLDLFLIAIGGILLLGLFTSALAERTFLPRATLLLLLGIVLGNDALDILPRLFNAHFDLIADLTLMMVGFLIGGKLSKSAFKTSIKTVISISLLAAVTTTFIVAVVLLWGGVAYELAVLLGVIAAATAPAAVVDVVQESHIENEFTRTLLSVVALDDLWALMLFALALAVLTNAAEPVSNYTMLFDAAIEVFGAIGLGIALGVPAAFLTGRIREGQPMMLEAVGLVCVCGGIALWLEVSYLIACMVLGATVANLAKHHDRPFHAIEHIESLFMVVFFVAAGSALEIHALGSLGFLGLAYIVLRSVGKYLGAWIGARLGHASEATARWMRFALLPQAGVSIGMALVASAQFPQHRQTLLTLVIGSTVFFEIVGPIYTRLAIHKANR